MQSRPMISVVMPVYNAENFIRESIDSILNQTFKDFEFLILNDGSTDSSLEIIKSYDDNRIKLIDNKDNSGVCAILNEGINMSIGRYIARMDSDDISSPDRFEKQIEFLERNKEYGLCCSNAKVIDEKGLLINDIMYVKDNSPLEWQLLWTNPIAHPSVMFRSSLVDGLPFFYNKEAFPAEDYDLWCRLSGTSKLFRLDETLLSYRIVSTSAYHSNFQSALNKSIQINESYLRAFTGKRNIPWYHFEIIRFSFTGKVEFDNFNIENIKSWTSDLVNVLSRKFNWNRAELEAVQVNNFQRYISLIKRSNSPLHKKILLFFKNVPSLVLLKTFLTRTRIKK